MGASTKTEGIIILFTWNCLSFTLFSNASTFDVESKRVIYGREIHTARLNPVTMRRTPETENEILRVFLQKPIGDCLS
jgi:hypothetical protein